MMVDCCKKSFVSYFVCVTVIIMCLFLSGCEKKQSLINTHYMPGHKFSDFINKSSSQLPSRGDNGITRTKSGLYIYKDNSTINTTGYKFNFKVRSDVGPMDVKFDAEHFRTRY